MVVALRVLLLCWADGGGMVVVVVVVVVVVEAPHPLTRAKSKPTE